MTSTAQKNPLQRLRSILKEDLPYCNGTLAVKPRDLVLYYGKGSRARRVDLSNATAAELDELEKACEPAPFGRNDQTVFDDSYRRAGKMEIDDFMLGFDADRAGLIEVARSSLFCGEEESKFVRAELYKLNVYGKDAFFKPHTDTPLSENMFGSLVVVLPTAHEGGALVLRHENREWTVDSCKLLSRPSTTPRVVFVSFFSDVEHEVTPVQSGHRLTVTYNLYFSDTPAALYPSAPPAGLRICNPRSENKHTISTALGALLTDEKILPGGGTLGFGLRHQYPLPKSWTGGDDDPLKALEAWLKGSDSALFRACVKYGLKPQLHLVYEAEGQNFDYNNGQIRTEDIVVPILFHEAVEVTEFYGLSDDSDSIQLLCEMSGGVVMFYRSLSPGADSDADHQPAAYDAEKRKYIQRLEDRWAWRDPRACRGIESRTVHFATGMTRFNKVKTAMIVHLGNGAGVDYMYKHVCLIVDLGPPGRRDEVKERKKK